MHRIVAALMLVGCVFSSGCSDVDIDTTSRARNEGWTSVRLNSVSRQDAMDAGVHAMKQFLRVADVSQSNGQIKSVTTEYDQRGGTERIRDTALKFKNRMRRTATLLIQDQGPDCIARCIVRVQRLDTADHRIFRENDRFTDYPSETPIDREAGVTAGQDQVWTDMPRDRQLESDILAVLRGRFTQATSASQPAAAVQP